MLSRRQRQMTARKQPDTWQQDLKRKRIFEKIDQQTRNTENILARLRARLEVLDLVVDKSLPEESFLASKEMHPWKFRRNQRLQDKWTFVNNVVTVQEMLVAVSDAKRRRDKTLSSSLQFNSQQTTLAPGQKASKSDPESVMNATSISRKDNQLTDEENCSRIAVHPSHDLSKQPTRARDQYKSNKQTGQELPSASLPVLDTETVLFRGPVGNIVITTEPFLQQDVRDAGLCSRFEDNDAVLSATTVEDSDVKTDANTKTVTTPNNNTLSPTTASPVVETNSLSKEDNFKLDTNLKRTLKCGPSIKPLRFSQFRTAARDLEMNGIYDWRQLPGTGVCQFCRKSACVGEQFQIYLAGKTNPDKRHPQSQPSARMKRRIADITAIYGFS